MSVAGSRYAKALFDALSPHKAQIGYDQLLSLNGVLREHPEARSLFENPTVSVDRRKAMLKQIGDASGFIPQIQNFVDALMEHNRLNLLEEIIRAYQKFLDENLGIVRAAVKTAQPLDQAQQNELAAKLGAVTRREVRMEVSVDPTLLGGIVAQVGGTIYDGSLRQQLKAFKAKLVQE